MTTRTWLIAVILAASCGDETHDQPEDAPADARVLPPGFPATLTIAASGATISIPFDATVSGTAGAPLGQISIADDAGTFALDGTAASSFVYAVSAFPGYTVYQGFAITPSRWDVYWLYCQGAALPSVYDESVDDVALFDAAATGACSDTGTMHDTAVALPTFSIAAPASRPGYTVSGNDINVHVDGTGSLVLGAETLPLVVFGDVDCSTGCGTPGWYELHSILWDDAQQRAIFAIIYLTIDTTDAVQITYARSLPDLGDPIGNIDVPATWTATQARAIGQRHLGMPPPR